MCLAVPVKVIKISGDKATVDAGGLLKEISILLVPEVKVGEYVLLHAGFAIQKIDEKEAKETLKIIRTCFQQNLVARKKTSWAGRNEKSGFI